MLHSLLSWCGCGLCNPVAGADTRQSIFERPMKRGDQRLEHIVNVPLPGCACWEHKTTPYYIYMITSLFHIYNIINRNENNLYIIHMCIYIYIVRWKNNTTKNSVITKQITAFYLDSLQLEIPFSRTISRLARLSGAHLCLSLFQTINQIIVGLCFQ